MRKMRGWMVRLAEFFKSRRSGHDFDTEIESHLQFHIEENIRLGMTPDEARRRAIIKLGGIESTKESYRDQQSLLGLENLWRDFRYGARMLRKNPGFTVVAVLTLALGIGANAGIFSLVHAVILRELPFANGDRLAVIWAYDPSKAGMMEAPPANADIAEWRNGEKPFASFENIAAFAPRSVDLAEGGEPMRIGAAGVTAGFFETLGVAPIRGRTFTREEEAFGAPPVALIGYGLWQRRFGADPKVVGSRVLMDGEPRTILGVLPPEFEFPRGAEWPAFFPFAGRTEVWLPIGLRPRDDGTGWSHWQARGERGLVVIGSLKVGVKRKQAQAELDSVASRLAEEFPDSHRNVRLKLVPMRDQLAQKSRRPLLMLFGGAALLLLIACVNVANLLLARGVARQQELTLRAALGAGRARLARQLLIEGLIMAVCGGGAGLLFAQSFLKVFLALNPMTRSRIDEASLNFTVVAFTIGVAFATTLIFGLAPALQGSRLACGGGAREGNRAVIGSIRKSLRGWLVSAEVALTVILLAIAGLMTRSLLRVLSLEPGFRPDSVLTFDVQLPSSRYNDDASSIRFFQQFTDRLQGLPGVTAAGAISYLPLGGGENIGGFMLEGETPPQPGNMPAAERRWVTPGYFATLGISNERGRVFTAADSMSQPKVCVINKKLATRFFKNGEPIGQRLKVGGAWRTIVGVVADVRSASLENEVRPQLYIPHAQWAWGGMTVALRTQGEPTAMLAAARAELKAMDPLLPAGNIRTMEQVLSKATSGRRFTMALLGFFAVAALLLTMLGIYGLVAFFASQRRREIGVRIALGAQPRNVVKLMLREGVAPVAIGSAVGLMFSLAATRMIASQLYGISPNDSTTLASIVVILLATAIVACSFPAWRAARIDPMDALRFE